MKTVLVLGINADIGESIANLFLNDGYRIVGTYRQKKPVFNSKKVELFRCDVESSSSINTLEKKLKKKKIKWDYIFSSIGTTEPIGKFFETRFDKWKKSINVNFISQMEVIHSLFKMRTKKKNSIILMAGGGTNGTFKNYSAYCVAKIALIKMCELIDDEYKDINIFIVGPGFTKTKGHLETIRAGKKAGTNYFRVKKFLSSKNRGTSFVDIYNCIKWGIGQGKKIVSGRNFSVVHDNWKTKPKFLQDRLKKNVSMYKLRRYLN